MAEPFTVQALTESDHAGVVEIYNHYVATSPCTFDTQAFTLARRAPWFAAFDGDRYRCLVARCGNQVLGYANSAPFKPKPAYQTSVEVSVYVAPDAQGQGIASELYQNLLQQLVCTSTHRAYGGIVLPNDGSVALHHKFGFVQVGLYREVGFKAGRYWDVAWFERSLDAL